LFFERFLNTSVDMYNIVIATLFKENYIKITQTGGKSILCTFVWGRSYIIAVYISCGILLINTSITFKNKFVV